MKKWDNEIDNMAIEFVEFDDSNKEIKHSFTPLGLYLHETEASAEEHEMTARLAAMSAGR